MNDLTYIIFLLGYEDPWREKVIALTEAVEADLVFSCCFSLAEEFLDSKYNDSNRPLYDCISDFMREVK